MGRRTKGPRAVFGTSLLLVSADPSPPIAGYLPAQSLPLPENGLNKLGTRGNVEEQASIKGGTSGRVLGTTDAQDSTKTVWS